MAAFGEFMTAVKCRKQESCLTLLEESLLTPLWMKENSSLDLEVCELISEFTVKQNRPIEYNQKTGVISNFMVSCSAQLCTPLQMANANGLHKVVDYLLELDDIDYSAFDRGGNTVFHIACMQGNCMLIKNLIKKGVDVNVCTKLGLTGLDLAIARGKNDVIDIFTELPNFNFESGSGNLPLIVATKMNSRPAVLEKLLTRVDINEQNSSGATALMWAARESKERAVKAFLAKGADVNLADASGNTALMYACMNQAGPVISLLMTESESIDINAANNFGNTAVYYAAKKNNVDIVAQLASMEGLNPFSENKNGDTAISVTISDDIRNLLQSVENAI